MQLTISKRLQVLETEKGHCLYHSLWGNPSWVSDDVLTLLELLKRGKTLKEIEKDYDIDNIEEFLQRLSEMGFLETGNDDEILAQRLAERHRVALSGGLLETLGFSITKRCNMMCQYCHVYKRLPSDDSQSMGDMSFNIARRAVDNFFSMIWKDKKSVKVIFFGGEPLLNWRVIKQVLEYIDQSNFNVNINKSIVTNGTLITHEIADALSSHDCLVMLSLDGLKNEHDRFRVFRSGQGTFELVVKNMAILREHGNRFVVVSVITKQTQQQLRDFVDFLHDKGVNEVIFKLAGYCSGSEEYLAVGYRKRVDLMVEAMSYANQKGLATADEMFFRARYSYCEGEGEVLTVEPNGDIYPCPGGILTKIGTVETMQDIPSSEEYLRLATRVVGNIPQCRGCEIEGLCAGACAGEVQFKCGDIYCTDTDICNLMRYLYKKLFSKVAAKSGEAESKEASSHFPEVAQDLLNGRENPTQNT